MLRRREAVISVFFFFLICNLNVHFFSFMFHFLLFAQFDRVVAAH